MVRAYASPEDRRLETTIVALTGGAMVAFAVTAVLVAPPSARTPVAWYVGTTVAIAAFLATVVHQLRHVVTGLRQRLSDQEAQLVWLARELMPAAVEHLRRGASVDEVLKGFLSARDDNLLLGEVHEALLRSLLEAIDTGEAEREASAHQLETLARRIQAIVNRQARALDEMQHRHERQPAVLSDLMRLDHGNAMAGRLADSIAVLSGARPGRQWNKPVALYSVLRGAMSRIESYERVVLHAVPEQIAIVGPAVEPLIHALAELLDNATRYSPPNTKVRVSGSEVNSGMAIEIDDGGLGLTEEKRRFAEQRLERANTSPKGLRLGDLGETPRLGLAVVGNLAHRYGFKVGLRTSEYGGVHAVLLVPKNLTTAQPPTGRAHGIGTSAGPVPDNRPRRAGSSRSVASTTKGSQSAATVSPEHSAGVLTKTLSGLPQRPRRASTASPSRADSFSTTDASTQPPAPSDASGAGGSSDFLDNFFSVSGDAASPARNGSDTSSDKGEQ